MSEAKMFLFWTFANMGGGAYNIFLSPPSPLTLTLILINTFVAGACAAAAGFCWRDGR